MIEISSLEPKQLFEGFVAKFIHTSSVTIAYLDVKKGAELPVHSHIHEQVTQVLEGRFQLTIGEETIVYQNGMVAVIPPNVPHSGIALTDCKLSDIFCPVREDYKKL